MSLNLAANFSPNAPKWVTTAAESEYRSKTWYPTPSALTLHSKSSVPGSERAAMLISSIKARHSVSRPAFRFNSSIQETSNAVNAAGVAIPGTGAFRDDQQPARGHQHA